jgi:hypothetical protein
VQGGHLDQLAQAFLDAGVDQHWLPEAFPAVDDPMSNGVSVSEPIAERVAQLAGVKHRARSRELVLAQRDVAVADEAQFDVARTRVDNEYPHAPNLVAVARPGPVANVGRVVAPPRAFMHGGAAARRPCPHAGCRAGR